MKKPELPPIRSLNVRKDGDTLFKLLQDLEVNQELHAIDKDYPYWEKFKYMVRRIDYPPELLWRYNKLSREKAISNIKVSGLKGVEFKFNTTGKILKYLHQFDLHLGGILEGRSIIPNDDKNRYLISSIMEEAIASSQLEGAVTTRVIAKQMLRSNRKPRNLSEKMILNNYLTIKKVIELKDKPISREVILELHSIISKGTLKNPDNEGKFRTNNEVNVVEDITGEIFYTPPDYNSIEELIECFCAFANDPNDSDFVHPIIRGIILHFLIGYIHPFMDGNGRTARAIFYWYLMSQGYWLLEYMAISKIIIRGPAQYARAYLHTEYDENDLTYFIEYNLKSMDLALRQLQKYIKRKVMEKQNLISLIQHENINERQAELLRSLIIDNHKSFTNKEVQTRFGVVYQTARTDLLGLQSLGYIKEKKFGKKLIYFKIDDFEKKLENVIGKDIEKPTVYEWDDVDDAKSANYKMEKTATINNSGSISTTVTE